ncbi:MAG: leucine-rich repeat protein [Ruminococcus callidus]
MKTIDEAAFYSCTALESLQIPEECHGDQAMRSAAVRTTSLQLRTASRVGNCAFLSCTQLTTVTFPAQMTSMGRRFQQLYRSETIAIPEGIRRWRRGIIRTMIPIRLFPGLYLAERVKLPSL